MQLGMPEDIRDLQGGPGDEQHLRGRSDSRHLA